MIDHYGSRIGTVLILAIGALLLSMVLWALVSGAALEASS